MSRFTEAEVLMQREAKLQANQCLGIYSPRTLVRDTSRQAREHATLEIKRVSFYHQRKKWGGEKTTFFLICVQKSGLISLVPPLILYGLKGTVMVLFKSQVY